MKILLVDDHQTVRRGLKILLQIMPHIDSVTEAVDGVDAIEKSSLTQPDIILMDVMMHGMTGIEATRAVLKVAPRAKVIGLSSLKDDATTQMMKDAGAIELLSKDLSANELVEKIYQIHKQKSASAAN